MDWQTKEHIDLRFDELEEKMDLIIEHLNIPEDSDIEDEDIEDIEDEEDSKPII